MRGFESGKISVVVTFYTADIKLISLLSIVGGDKVGTPSYLYREVFTTGHQRSA